MTKLAFVCPQCKGALETEPEAYRCPACERSFPVVLGIPDFRVYPDPYIDYEDDRAKARRVASQYERLDFEGLVRYYWEITPGIPEDMVGKFVAHARSGVERGCEYLDEIESRVPAASLGSGDMLEVGCGTGGFLVAAAPRFRRAIGSDIAMRWLVIAKKHFQEKGLDIPLVCCCAEFLPFAADSFDVIVANNVLEHVSGQKEMAQEGYRALKSPGTLFWVTTNRFTLGPEPHVRVWGVGLLPRRWMEPYVRLVRRIPYRFIRSLSCFELRALLRRSPFRKFRVIAPSITASQAGQMGARGKTLARVFNTCQRTPGIAWLLHFASPLYYVLCLKHEDIAG